MKEEKETNQNSLNEFCAKNDVFLNFDSEVKLKCLEFALGTSGINGDKPNSTEAIDAATQFYNFITSTTNTTK